MLAQKLVLSYTSKIAIQVVQMAAMLVVARIVGPNVLGIVAFGLAYVTMFSFISDLGLSSAHMKLISEGQDEAKCIGTFATLKIILTAIYVVVVLGYFFGQKYLFGVAFESPEHEYVIFIYLVLTAISQMFFIPSSTFAARTEQAKQDFPVFVQTIVYQILRIVIVLLGYRAVALAFSNLAAVLIVIPLYLFLFKDYKIGSYDKALAKKYFNITFPMIFIGIAQTIMFSTDRVILQYLTNSEEVGYYSAAFSLSQFVRLIESSAGILFFPLFSKNIAENEYGKLNNSVNKYERFTLAFILPLVLAVVICSDIAVRIALGKKFMQTIPILGTITFAMFVSTIALPYINIISGKGLFKMSAVLHLLTSLFFLISAYILVAPSLLNLEGVGVSVALLSTNVLLGLIFMLYVRKKAPEVKILQGRYLLLFGLVFGAAGFIVYKLFIFEFVVKIIFGILFVAAYFAVARLTNVVKKDDWLMLSEIINFKKLFGYISSELRDKKDEK